MLKSCFALFFSKVRSENLRIFFRTELRSFTLCSAHVTFTALLIPFLDCFGEKLLVPRVWQQPCSHLSVWSLSSLLMTVGGGVGGGETVLSGSGIRQCCYYTTTYTAVIPLAAHPPPPPPPPPQHSWRRGAQSTCIVYLSTEL